MRPFVLAASHEGLVNFNFVLPAPWKACRLCGALYQSDLDRRAYEYAMRGDDEQANIVLYAAKDRRERWLRLHNRRKHTWHELERFAMSELVLTPEAANKLAPFGIIHVGTTVYLDEIDSALFDAPRAPIDDCEGSDN